MGIKIRISCVGKQQGAIIDKGADFTEKVVVDKNLITGQNPQLSHKIATVILEILNNKN